MVNITTVANRTVLENAPPQRGNPSRFDAVNTTASSTQVTVYETIIELENVTSTQNVSVLVNETVRYNATYNVTYDVLRNVTYDVTFNETYNARFRRGASNAAPSAKTPSARVPAQAQKRPASVSIR